MMRWFIFFSLLLAGQVLAQQINIRSGAHESFARLVLDVPTGTSWTIDQKVNGVRIEVNDHLGGFDISTVFTRIDRTFISNITTDEKSIFVEFSCDCAANIFAEGARMVVMDISPAPDQQTITPNSPGLVFLDQRSLRFDRTKEGTNAIKPTEQRAISSTSLDDVGFPLVENNFPSFSIQEIGLASDTEQLLQAQIELSRQIGAAATRGMLTPSNQRFDLGAAPTQPQIDTRIFDSTALNQDHTARIEVPRDNIKITSSSDAPQFLDGRLQNRTSIAASCINPELIDIQNWGVEVGLPAEVAKLRGRLFGEFDRLDHDVAIKLARVYLHYGFGAEARQTLLLDGVLAEAHPALMSIAQIMEYGHDKLPSYLERFVDCNSAAALWSILSKPTIDPNITINTKAALLGLSGLPLHLRAFIAPELSHRFLTYGDQNAATAALRSLERGPDTLSPNAIFAEANLKMAQGDTKMAQEQLSDVVKSNTEQSAEALIVYVNSHLNQGTEIEVEVATLIEAYAMEMRDSAIGDELAQAHVLALGKSGQFSAAFAALSRIRERIADAHESELRSSVLDILTHDASDVEFLDHTFAQLSIEPKVISAVTRFHIAKRLAELGFYEQGEMILSIEPRHPNSSEMKLLEARISLALSRPYEALAHLLGETSEAAEELRAQAEVSVGDFAKAHSTYNAIGDEENSRRTAWLSDDWSVLTKEAAPIFGPVVRVSQSTLENSSELEGMLGRATTAISESQQARQAIQDLLSSDGSGMFVN